MSLFEKNAQSTSLVRCLRWSYAGGQDPGAYCWYGYCPGGNVQTSGAHPGSGSAAPYREARRARKPGAALCRAYPLSRCRGHGRCPVAHDQGWPSRGQSCPHRAATGGHVGQYAPNDATSHCPTRRVSRRSDSGGRRTAGQPPTFWSDNVSSRGYCGCGPGRSALRTSRGLPCWEAANRSASARASSGSMRDT